MTLDEFNGAGFDAAVAVLLPCLDIPRWAGALLARRPYATIDGVVAAARDAADPFTLAELDRALSHHPRIGERAGGSGAAARMSAAEQASLGASSAELERALADGNAEYERKFNRVFLIRAAGRTRAEILAELKHRMAHTEAEELVVIAQQLREIAALRLTGVIQA
ncbi:MAG TPA: 2-oxo-4-hydroxy-4-carboxy-5-ureidoimidazoline decarboxylase [Nevskiaceae bacterium]|nr:2-oxo-4-hydroxy-4-carboxy-5-ureidoimidazoline decarboxylase [Nevskiaceae bacterium]